MSECELEGGVLSAAEPLRVPGAGEVRVLTAAAVERLALAHGLPRRLVEAAALEAGVTPLHYLRNLAEIRAEGQARLLRATVALTGHAAVLRRALDLLAQKGVGRCLLLLPPAAPESEVEGLRAAVRNRNASCEVEVRSLRLRSGDPRAALEGARAVGACLADSADEQLLQFACRTLRLPLVLAAAEGHRGHATTVHPGDAGVALVYRATQPHLDARRSDAVEPRAALMVGAWLAEQLLALLLDEGPVLAGRLLYADLAAAEMGEWELGA